MRDPYEVLGVPKNAAAAAHQERLPASWPRSCIRTPTSRTRRPASKFAELNAAYEILGEDSKRKAFDRGEIDAEGKPRFQGFEGFGRRGSASAGGFGQDGGFESFTYGPRRISARRRARPRRGRISRRHRRHPQGNVRRHGRRQAAPAGVRDSQPEDFAGPAQARDVTGAVTITLPEAAKGTTRRVQLPTGKEIEAKIPAGLADGQTIRLKGQGLPGPDGGVGDALITVSIAPHPLFARDGANLRLELPITLYEAVLGAKVRVPTLDGAVELAIPPGTNSGRTFRLKGKGSAGEGRRGRSLCDRAHHAARAQRSRS